jgi:hypothetical protein
VVPADNRRGSGVHRLRFEPAGGIDIGQVGAGMLGDVCKWRGVRRIQGQQGQKWGIREEKGRTNIVVKSLWLGKWKNGTENLRRRADRNEIDEKKKD